MGGGIICIIRVIFTCYRQLASVGVEVLPVLIYYIYSYIIYHAIYPLR